MQLTKQQLDKALPRHLRGRVTEDILGTINNILLDPLLKDSYRENLLSYTSVLQDGKYRIQDYVNAVKYVTHRLLGSSQIEAYSKTFPDRIQRLVDEGSNDKTISAYVSAYNKNQLVNKILEQTLVPSHVLNADLYQRAINVQADLMLNANSEKVRSDAANSLLIHLKPPETAKVEIDMTVKKDSTIDELREATQELVRQQRELIEKRGISMKDISASKISKVIDGEFTSENT